MSSINLDSIAEKLAKATENEKSVEEIKAEIDGLMQQYGYDLTGAIATWKSDNKNLLAVERTDITARVIAKEVPRTSNYQGGSSEVGNIHMLVMTEAGKPAFVNASAWGSDRIDLLYDLFQLDKCYAFKARLDWDSGRVTHIRTATEVPDSESGIPTMAEIDGYPLEDLPQVEGTYEYVRGWVGKVIESSGEVIGFEVDDLGVAPPMTVWFAGQYAKMTPDQIQDVIVQLSRGIEVGVYGYINKDLNMSAATIYFF